MTMPLYWLVYRHNNQISIVIEPGASLIHARMRSALDGLDEGEFTEGHELERKWRVPKAMIGRRLSQEFTWKSNKAGNAFYPTCRVSDFPERFLERSVRQRTVQQINAGLTRPVRVRRSRHLQRLACHHPPGSDFDPHPFSRIRLRPHRRASMTLRIVVRPPTRPDASRTSCEARSARVARRHLR